LTRGHALILATILLSCVRVSGALAADLTLFEGPWNGHWTRTSGPEQGSSGALVTTFTVRHNRLEGTHYGITIEEVVVQDRQVRFEHPYGGCRAHHTFTVDSDDNNKAKSVYRVESCADGTQNHTGEITYIKTP
jgi:hypothetical protein